MAHLIHIKSCRDFFDEKEFNIQELACQLWQLFGEQFICFKLDDENSLYMVLFRQIDFLVRIKHCFHRVSCGRVRRSNTCSSNESVVSFIIWCQKNSVFLCNNYMMNNVIKALCVYLDANGFRISFMEYNKEDTSFKPKYKNKNFKEPNHSFTEKLCNRIRGNDSLLRTSCVITRDKPLLGTNSVKRKIIFTPINKKSIKLVEPRSHVPEKINSKNAYELTTNPIPNVHYVCNVYPLHGANSKNPLFPGYTDVTRATGLSLQESIRYLVRRPDQTTGQNNIELGLQSLSLQDERQLCDTSNFNYGTAHTCINNGASNVTLEVSTPQVASKHEICFSGSSFERRHQLQHNETFSNDARVSTTDYRLLNPFNTQQNRPCSSELTGDIAPANHQPQIKQQPEANFTAFTRPQDDAQQRKNNDDLHVFGRVRSPENSRFTDRMHTFSRWPSATIQTPARVAEAGFYYTGLHDIVRCFVCDGGLKNWDSDDDPWVEHARWFPQCAYVRHIKGEEFINLVQMMIDDSDEEDECTVHRGATWGAAKSNIKSNESASKEVTEPSVLQNDAAQLVLNIGYSERHVAMAMNTILKKGKMEFTEQDILDVILDKKIDVEQIDSKLSFNGSPSVRNSPADAEMLFENQSLKKLIHCIECKTKERNILFLPCTHHVVCESCSRDLEICTSCYRRIKEKVRTYMV